MGEAGETLPQRVWGGWRHDLPTLPSIDFTGQERTTHDWECGVFRWPDTAGGEPGPTPLYELPPRPGGRNVWETTDSSDRA